MFTPKEKKLFEELAWQQERADDLLYHYFFQPDFLKERYYERYLKVCQRIGEIQSELGFSQDKSWLASWTGTKRIERRRKLG